MKDERTKTALEMLNAGASLRGAAASCGINRQTLKNRLENRHVGLVGRPTILLEEEEAELAERIQLLGDWGFPLTPLDVKMIVKSYVNRLGVKKDRWKNNIPGDEWVSSFAKRNNLSRRMVSNITRRRAQVSKTTINDYFGELAKALEGIPPENIVNYDETCLVDDPGKKRCLVKRGVKYPENVLNHSKSGVSVMFAGSASGEFLPPYVIYKAQNLYKQWTIGGPQGARYTFSKSWWIDENAFEDWFIHVVLPYFKRKEGPKAIIGDNLASHISANVVSKCNQHGIKFICLPPNSTHLTQPLDVAVFSALKANWRRIIQDWKKTPAGMKFGTLPKQQFPTLLKRLVLSLNSENLKSGFRACGIHPLDPQEVLKRLPNTDIDLNDSRTSMNDAFLEHLQNLRGTKEGSGSSKLRRTKLGVVPSRSVGECESDTPSDTDLNEQEHIEEFFLDDDKENCPREDAVDYFRIRNSQFLLVSLAAKKSSRCFVAQVIKIEENSTNTRREITVSFLKKVGDKQYGFPENEDISVVYPSEITSILDKVVPDRRGSIFTIHDDLDMI